MDIIDILLAKKLTSQGQVDTYAAKAQQAAKDASDAETRAESAVNNIESITEQTQANNEAAAQALQDVRLALENLDGASSVNDLHFELNPQQTSSAYNQALKVTYPDGTVHTLSPLVKLYKSYGDNEDGGMTQKAIKTYVQQVASTAGGGGESTNLDPENSGKIVVIGPDGNIGAGTVTEDELINIIGADSSHIAGDALGLEIDYDNKSCTRLAKAATEDFDQYLMYGGRTRCNVDDNGAITAFYGDSNYRDDGSNGQVMVYQPKFYYKRVPIALSTNAVGKVVNKEYIAISYAPLTSYKIHPAFITSEGEILEYILYSAYEGSLYDASENTYIDRTASTVDFSADKLSSVANAKPITGSSGLSLEKAEQLARNRGEGWHISTLVTESANQMLEIVEFGTVNGQTALGKGISDIASQGSYNQAAITGSTASLGNTSGAAASTIFENNNTITTETENGKVAISYRGIENPWGNVWKMLGDVLVYGTTSTNGGVPYICSNYKYSYTATTRDYTSVGFCLPNTNGWISNLGYGKEEYDWVLMPAGSNAEANSAVPIGDNGWFDKNLQGLRLVIVGGSWAFGESNGPFYYGCDKLPTDSTFRSYGARLIYIPTINAIYNANLAKWKRLVGE